MSPHAKIHRKSDARYNQEGFPGSASFGSRDGIEDLALKVDLEAASEPAFMPRAFGCSQKVAWKTAGQCYFTADQGYIGLAGHEVKENDVICHLSNFPPKKSAVLRPQSDGTFLLITFAYVDELLLEAVFAQLEASEVREFTLK
jgi:hypothetical protein